MNRLRIPVSVLKPNDAQELLDQFSNEKTMTVELGGGNGFHAVLRPVVSSALGTVFKATDSFRTGL